MAALNFNRWKPPSQQFADDRVRIAFSSLAAHINEQSLLAEASYLPSGTTTYSTTSGTFVDLDATNLSVSFVVPRSEAVIVRFSTVGVVLTLGGSMFWNLREGTTNVTGSACFATGATAAEVVSRDIKISGLAAGKPLTWKWGWRSGVAGNEIRVLAGNSAAFPYGPAAMSVRAAPSS